MKILLLPGRLLRTSRKAWLVLLKLLSQLAGVGKPPEIFIDSLNDSRSSYFLAVSLASEYGIEIRLGDIQKIYNCLSLHDFIFNTTILLPGRRPLAPIVLSQNAGNQFPEKQRILIDGDYYSSQKRVSTEIIAPYFAHPEFYQAKLHLKPAIFRPGPRFFRVFFCGTVDRKTYSQGFRFPILNRSEIIGYVLSKFSDQISHSVEGPKKAITLIITDDTRDIVHKHLLTLDRYFEALKNADFFIAPPGWVMPHSHNIIEAFTAGAVPITNYGHYFTPPLQNGINCLSFSNHEELNRVVREAIRMSPERINFLRRGALDYYHRYLAPSAFGAQFRKTWVSSKPLLVNLERFDYGPN